MTLHARGYLRSRLLGTALCLSALGVSACGGGGTPDGPVVPPVVMPPVPPVPPAPPVPENTAPTLTVSAQLASVAENSTDPIVVISATDADGDPVTLSLDGADGALFSLNAAGEISFTTAPDFEAPGDADGDNVYAITAVASDGRGATASETVGITVTDLTPLPTFTLITEGLSFPTYAAELPETNGKLLVLEKGGTAKLLDPADGTTTTFLDFTEISSEGEGGLLGFAVPADYATSRTIYFHVNNEAGDTEIRRYQLASGTTERADPSTREVVIRIGQPRNNHNAGSIGFDRNGYLVVPMGDGGGAGDPNGFAQNPQSLLGKVLRLDVAADDYPNNAVRNYAIPPGNTFADAADGRPEIFAVGLRNPFRSTFDPATGDLLIADVGQDEREEVNRLPMTDSSLNFGWNIREGSIEYGGNGNAPGLTLPIAEYEHGNGPTQGNSITGGVVFDGESDVLDNAYLFADFSSDNIWAIPADTVVGDTPLQGANFRRINDQLLLGSARPSGVVSMTLSSENAVYVTAIGGAVFRLDERE